MRKSVSCMLVLGATITACQPGEAQESTYRVGERVELQASGDHWQSCVVTDPGSQYAVMRLRCDPYDAPGYSRGGGVYNESYNSTGVRRPAQAGNPVAAAPGRAGLPRNSTGGAGTGSRATGYHVGQAQESTYRVGERVELQASGDHWQSCVVTEPGSQYAVMRLRCDPYDAPGYSRGGGVYNESYNSTGVRRPAQAGNPVAAAPGRAGLPRNSTGGAGTGSRATGYHVGQAVEVEASGHWVPCTISSIDQAGGLPMIRTYCPEYPALSRAAGTYIVHNNETGLRPATGRIGRAPEPVAAPVNRSPAGRGGSLPLGEYACYGSGGSIMIGLGFRLTGSSSYTDLDGASRGTYTISGTNISFRGGHLDGQTGRDIEGKGFRIGSQATCELW